MTFERSSPRHPEEEAEERMSSRGWIRVCVDIYIYIHTKRIVHNCSTLRCIPKGTQVWSSNVEKLLYTAFVFCLCEVQTPPQRGLSARDKDTSSERISPAGIGTLGGRIIRYRTNTGVTFFTD
jgi:hypothetical protein